MFHVLICACEGKNKQIFLLRRSWSAEYDTIYLSLIRECFKAKLLQLNQYVPLRWWLLRDTLFMGDSVLF